MNVAILDQGVSFNLRELTRNLARLDVPGYFQHFNVNIVGNEPKHLDQSIDLAVDVSRNKHSFEIVNQIESFRE